MTCGWARSLMACKQDVQSWHEECHIPASVSAAYLGCAADLRACRHGDNRHPGNVPHGMVLLQIFEHVDMVTTDILATFLMAAAAQQCKRRATVVAMVNQSHSCGLAPDLPTDIPVESSAACFGNRSVFLNPTCTLRVTRISQPEQLGPWHLLITQTSQKRLYPKTYFTDHLRCEACQPCREPWSK